MPSSHLNISSHACIPEAPHIHSHLNVTLSTLHGEKKKKTFRKIHVSDACMKTQSTGVPGAGLFWEQSDIYRSEREKRGGAVGGGGLL